MKNILPLLLTIPAILYAQDTPDALIKKGNDYYALARYDLAENFYREALSRDPQNGTAQYNLSNTLIQQKKFDDADNILNNIIASAKNNSLKEASYYNKGVAYSKQKKLEESIEAYKNALRLDPDDKNARENLQKALLEQKKQKQNQAQQKQQKPQSRLSEQQAEQKLKALQEKEKQLQEKIQKSNQKGSTMPKDW